MRRATAEDLRRRLVNTTPSGMPRRQAIALARDAIAYATELEREIERLRGSTATDARPPQ